MTFEEPMDDDARDRDVAPDETSTDIDTEPSADEGTAVPAGDLAEDDAPDDGDDASDEADSEARDVTDDDADADDAASDGDGDDDDADEADLPASAHDAESHDTDADLDEPLGEGQAPEGSADVPAEDHVQTPLFEADDTLAPVEPGVDEHEVVPSFLASEEADDQPIDPDSEAWSIDESVAPSGDDDAERDQDTDELPQVSDEASEAATLAMLESLETPSSFFDATPTAIMPPILGDVPIEPEPAAQDAAAPEQQAAAPVAAAPAAPVDPLLSRRRRALLPSWLIPTIIAAAVVIGLVTFFVWRAQQNALVEVPEIVGLSQAQAKARLEDKGLQVVRSDSRYSSSIPKGGVLAQDPKPGVKVKRGTKITIVISVGSETVQMPDVIGMSLADAQRVLGSLGLTVNVERVASEEATPDVVLSTVPSPGVNISTSDVVRLAAAGSVESSSGALLPYKFDARTFVIDPSVISSGAPDAPMEVSRRLRALLEASGARVVVTRSVVDTDTSAGARARRAADASPTAIVGLDVGVTGRGGLTILSIPPSRQSQANYQPSLQLSREVYDALQLPSEKAQQGLPVDDAVAFWTAAAGVRVQLGSSAAAGDRLALSDPDRNDAIARGIYRALGRLYGTR